MNEIKGSTALVTGAAGGIGAATARTFAREGAEAMVLSDAAVESLEALAREIESETGCRCLTVNADLSDPESIRNLFSLSDGFLEGPDILVNCAGICPVAPLENITPESWDFTMAVNLRGTFLCCQQAVPRMRARSRGSIINLSSISGRIGGIATGLDYVSSKGALLAFTKGLAKTLGPYGIRANNVSPGFIATGMTRGFTHFDPRSVPLGRIGEPEDVADVILFLASERSRYITGCTLDVTGGLYMN